MANYICVIIPYFGKFKPSINLFLNSCIKNKEIDWYIFTDNYAPKSISLTKNIKWIKIDLSTVKKLAKKNLGHDICLERPYKLCDLKPFYGLIFKEYIQNYQYWGYGDLDVVYGRLFYYLNLIEYYRYDKVNWMGHLCFLKNNADCNYLAFHDTPDTVSGLEVLKIKENIGFDERDFNKKLLSKELKMYNFNWGADIDIFYQRMRCVDLKTVHCLLDTGEVNYAPKNYRKQIFALVDGKVFQIYLKAGQVCTQEFAYIHFRKESPILFDDYDRQTYLFTRKGFVPCNQSDLSNYYKVNDLIEQYNHYGGFLKETYEFLYQYYRKISGKRGW
ncbi:DUF6625 family protein [uncultured Thomasclavelia sp.]|uniref:DUF6625 family protein n=1 Tax=uncultured Thomasclavelia sp. TaxID=3025759 RepID=UPI00262AE0EF|nr:DUF6625 family protein [uncultured Thomasclavelia sp.]